MTRHSEVSPPSHFAPWGWACERAWGGQLALGEGVSGLHTVVKASTVYFLQSAMGTVPTRLVKNSRRRVEACIVL